MEYKPATQDQLRANYEAKANAKVQAGADAKATSEAETEAGAEAKSKRSQATAGVLWLGNIEIIADGEHAIVDPNCEAVPYDPTPNPSPSPTLRLISNPNPDPTLKNCSNPDPTATPNPKNTLVYLNCEVDMDCGYGQG